MTSLPIETVFSTMATLTTSKDDEEEEKGNVANPSQLSISPLLIPPQNFAMIAKGIYRSGYPNSKNYPFMQKLGLKSLL